MRSSIASAAFVALLWSGSARADDWPQWLGPQRDGVWRETGILDKFPAGGPTVRWRTPISAGYSGPAVAGGRVFVTDRVLAEGAKDPKDPFKRGNTPSTERVICLNQADGKILWTYSYDCPYTISYPLGPRTTPSVSDGRVYTFGAEGNLVCLGVEKGDLVWARDLKKDYGVKAPLWGFSSHPLVDGQKLIVVGGGKGSIVVALDRATGKELWKALSAEEPGYCPPVIFETGGKRQLIVWDSDAVSSLDPETGSVYWSQPLKPAMAMAIATPRLQANSLFLTGPGAAALLHLRDGAPAAEVAWRGDKMKGFQSVFGTPFFEDGYLYGVGKDAALVCVKAETGEKLWETMAPNRGKKLQSGDFFIVKNGDRFFLYVESGDLIIAKLSPKGYQEIDRAHLVDPMSAAFGRVVVWSHPAFADRCVFARNDKEIVCVSLAAP